MLPVEITQLDDQEFIKLRLEIPCKAGRSVGDSCCVKEVTFNKDVSSDDMISSITNQVRGHVRTHNLIKPTSEASLSSVLGTKKVKL